MTVLNVLGNMLNLEPSVADSHNTALAFAFNSAYLTPFKTMIASMALSKTMLSAPIYVFSDDAEVFKDPFVKAAVDHGILLDEHLKDVLYDLAEHNVKRSERTSWNRGTFLKWAIFRDYTEQQVLFLDVDMVCLQPIEPLLTLDQSADLIGCPQFQRAVKYDANGKKLSSIMIADNIRGMLDDTAKKLMYRLNSGVMLVRKSLLNDDFRDEIISFARTGVEVNEQSHITKFFGESQKKMKLTSSKYNFHESYFKDVEPDIHAEFLSKIHIMHYPGSEKPWKFNQKSDMRPSLRCWWDAYSILGKYA